MCWRSSAIADCVPYLSGAGMLRSSIRYTSFLVPGGPKVVPDFFSSGCSRMGCSAAAFEKELKLIVYESMLSGSERSLSASTVVFAVPALPTSITGAPSGSSWSSMNPSRVVSIVGTTIDAKSADGRWLYAGIRPRQCASSPPPPGTT